MRFFHALMGVSVGALLLGEAQASEKPDESQSRPSGSHQQDDLFEFNSSSINQSDGAITGFDLEDFTGFAKAQPKLHAYTLVAGVSEKLSNAAESFMNEQQTQKLNNANRQILKEDKKVLKTSIKEVNAKKTELLDAIANHNKDLDIKKSLQEADAGDIDFYRNKAMIAITVAMEKAEIELKGVVKNPLSP